MSRKGKGTNAERELIHLFWAHGWAAVRVAGSGSSRYPSPDILAGNNLRKLAIECKAVKATDKYLTEGEVENLQTFAQLFGAEPWIGVRFDKENWYFTGVSDLVKTENCYKVSLGGSKRFGLLFEELIK